MNDINRRAEALAIAGSYGPAEPLAESEQVNLEELLDTNHLILTEIIADIDDELTGDVALLTYEKQNTRPLKAEIKRAWEVRGSQLLTQLEKLPQRHAIIDSWLAQYGITDPLDDQFVAASLSYIEQNSQRPHVYKPPVADAFVVRQQLALRTRNSEAEEAPSEYHVNLSNNRQVTFHYGAQNRLDSIGLALQPNKPRRPVALGAAAVDTLLDGPLSDEDYGALATTALRLPGEIGRLCRTYQYAVKLWALRESVRAPDIAEQVKLRKQAGHALYRALGQTICNELVVNAIFVLELRVSPLLDNYVSPQPYSQ